MACFTSCTIDCFTRDLALCTDDLPNVEHCVPQSAPQGELSLFIKLHAIYDRVYDLILTGFFTKLVKTEGPATSKNSVQDSTIFKTFRIL